MVFERAGELLGEYEAAAVQANVRLNKTATSELRERLRYLDLTLEMVRESAGQLDALNKVVAADPIDRDTWDRRFLQVDRTRILTETFYFICGRIGELLKERDWIPYVGDPGFIGAYQVRHKLLEHFDADQAPFEQGPSFGVSGLDGPMLQPGMSREWIDKGLYPNARELAEVLERRIANALDRVKAARDGDRNEELTPHPASPERTRSKMAAVSRCIVGVTCE